MPGDFWSGRNTSLSYWRFQRRHLFAKFAEARRSGDVEDVEFRMGGLHFLTMCWYSLVSLTCANIIILKWIIDGSVGEIGNSTYLIDNINSIFRLAVYPSVIFYCFLLFMLHKKIQKIYISSDSHKMNR